MNEIQVNVGSQADMGKRFAGAWNRAATGEKVFEPNVTFLDVQTMLTRYPPAALTCCAIFASMGPVMSGH